MSSLPPRNPAGRNPAGRPDDSPPRDPDSRGVTDSRGDPDPPRNPAALRGTNLQETALRETALRETDLQDTDLQETALRETDRVASDARRLIARLADLGPVTVAFSGGVDSSVVAAAARRADPHHGLAVTAASPSVPRWQLETARRIAAVVGIPHRVVSTDEVSRPDYRRNDGRRCYHCKETLYATLATLAEDSRRTTVSGTNADDLGDYRPGIDAAGAAGVRAPLAELGITKRRVRALAAFFGLPNADLPASPCLASRVAYGVEVTPERLGMIEAAEGWLRDRGFSDLRVRLHADALARVEVPPAELPRLLEPAMLTELDRQLTAVGFRFVTVDVRGLRSGSLNPPLVTLQPPSSVDPAARIPAAGHREGTNVER